MRKNVLYMWQSRSFFIIKLTDLHFVLRIGHKHGKHIVPKALKNNHITNRIGSSTVTT